MVQADSGASQSGLRSPEQQFKFGTWYDFGDQKPSKLDEIIVCYFAGRPARKIVTSAWWSDKYRMWRTASTGLADSEILKWMPMPPPPSSSADSLNQTTSEGADNA